MPHVFVLLIEGDDELADSLEADVVDGFFWLFPQE
jgi:hypothetical protein